MSILSSLLNKKITWSQAAAQVLSWGEKTIANDPTLTQATSEALTIVKQGASDAIAIADTALAGHAAQLATAVETAIDTALAAASGGLTVPLNPLMDSGISQLLNVVINVAHTKGLEFRASLAPAPAKSGNATVVQGQ